MVEIFRTKLVRNDASAIDRPRHLIDRIMHSRLLHAASAKPVAFPPCRP